MKAFDIVWLFNRVQKSLGQNFPHPIIGGKFGRLDKLFQQSQRKFTDSVQCQRLLSCLACFLFYSAEGLLQWLCLCFIMTHDKIALQLFSYCMQVIMIVFMLVVTDWIICWSMIIMGTSNQKVFTSFHPFRVWAEFANPSYFCVMNQNQKISKISMYVHDL